MTIERTIQGTWRISAIHDGHLVTRLYVGYTKRQAIISFMGEIR